MSKHVRAQDVWPVLVMVLMTSAFAFFENWEICAVCFILTLACLYFTIEGIQESFSEERPLTRFQRFFKKATGFLPRFIGRRK